MKKTMVVVMALIMATRLYSMEQVAAVKNQESLNLVTMASLTATVNHLYHRGKPYQESKDMEYQQPNVHDQYFVHLAVDHGKLACSPKLALLDYQQEKLQNMIVLLNAMHTSDSKRKKDEQLRKQVSYFCVQGPHSHMDHPKLCINLTVPNRLTLYTDIRRRLSPCTIGIINQADNTIIVQTIVGIDDGFNILEPYIKKQYHAAKELAIAHLLLTTALTRTIHFTRRK